MDGTLVDTEPYWMAAETPLVERFGGTWTHDDGLGMVGLGLEDAARILQGAGVRMEVDEIVAHLTEEVMRQLREEGVPFRPGARELLRDLRDAGIPTALVTMSMSRMARVITGDDVARPKPHPDPYLQACEALGVDPADTVAFEDSITGTRSAIAAGTATVGIPHMVPLDEVGAHVLWPTLEGRTVADVADLLAQVRQGVRA
jgi:HAD superfamily hydrolase (TIGR01509 family)